MYHSQRWTLEKIKQRLELIIPLVYRRTTPLPAFRYQELADPVALPPIACSVDDSAWTKIDANDYWGMWMTNFVLRTSFTIPSDWGKTQPIALHLPLGEAGDFSHPEALAYIDESPYAACDRHHQEILLRPEWADGQPHLLVLHGWTGLGGATQGDFFSKLFMRRCSLVQIDQPTRDFVIQARVTVETIQNLDANNPTRYSLLNALETAFLMLDTRDPLGESFYASVPAALAVFNQELAKTSASLDATIHATGHAHIDVAWLWTLGQTRRKSERTFFNVIRLMEQFPTYHFTQSQPQLYQYICEDQPELFQAIRQRIDEGRWEPIGGMWVEADCNISGAESLARQFLLGRSFFQEHFGKNADSPVLWLPDVFGYAWALPQLIKQAGLKYFMTIKIGWSQYNRLPYDTFMWQGLDGTQILTHFSTVKEFGSEYASTYNSMANPKEALGAWSNFQQKEMQRDLLMAYGFGDGGGGPTREMLENIEVMSNFPGLPHIHQSSVKKFFEAITPLASERMMPVWNGELYLEYHRGTYTTQARNKRANRKSEFLLHDAEFIASMATQLDPNYAYPTSRFKQAWQTVCLNQFHDIIPGSSIGPVYEESQAQYAELAKDIAAVRAEALNSLAKKIDGEVLLINPTSFARADLAFLPGEFSSGFARDGQPVPIQQVAGGLFIDAGALPPYSVTPITFSSTMLSLPFVQNEQNILENNFVRVEFDTYGDIVRIFDKTAQREVLSSGAIANQFQAFEDRPKSWDAWDVDIFYDDKVWLAQPAQSIQLIETGPLLQVMEIKRRILNSTYTQRISLYHNSARLDFETVIQWNERHIMLKVAFPVDVLAPQATYEIQWGNVERPTHRNTSWDWARFETCAHKWVDLSEGGYGVSLLNDCKYGHDIRDNVMRLTLLRSPTMPDPTADMGEHQFKYSLLPHIGNWTEKTQAEAYALNDPILVYRVHSSAERGSEARTKSLESFVACSAPNVIIETVKRAEDGNGFIIRLYESQRKRGPVTVCTAFQLEAAWETNLLEENESTLSIEGNQVHLILRPYQIMTLRLLPTR